MERLTENFLGCYQIKGCDNFTCEETCNNVLNCGCCPISEAINKLAEYEDLEEQGLLLRLEKPFEENISKEGDNKDVT